MCLPRLEEWTEPGAQEIWQAFMNAPRVPLFLSAKGLDTVRAIYRRRNATTDRPATGDYDRARAFLFDEPWDDYDKVYIALYTLRLTGGKWLPRKDFEAPPENNRQSRLQLDCTLELDVKPDYGRQWLLDEWAVAEIIGFRSALQQVLPYHLRVIYVGFGCFMLSFLLSGGDAEGRCGDAGADAAILNEYVRGESFLAIRQRYNVSRFEITQPPR
jgi:hypothetical protein